MWVGSSGVGLVCVGLTWSGLESPALLAEELSTGTGTAPVSEALVVKVQGLEEDALALALAEVAVEVTGSGVAEVTGTGASEAEAVFSWALAQGHSGWVQTLAVSMEVTVSTAEDPFAGTAPAVVLAARARRVTAWACLKCILSLDF